ncbi:MAG: hypothetical protein K8S94_07780 [Planctomycetia bacterium]|nr:hypothetical protein [Planctomycetia bacterium]
MTIANPLSQPVGALSRAPRFLSRVAPLLVTAALATAVSAAEQDRAKAVTRSASGQRSTAIVDRAVVPAGGAACQQCGPGGCRHAHAAAHRHHRDCRDGACAPYCPVRPSTFGFYGTQWRRWPGQGVVPVSNEQAVTPATPPKSEVPGADEESRGPKPFELPEPEDESATAPTDDTADDRKSLPADAPLPPEPEAEEPEPVEPKRGRGPTERETPNRPTKPAEGESAPAPEPRELPRGEEKPAAATETPPSPRPEDENLFDDSAARKVRRKIPVQDATRPAVVGSAGGVQPAAHQPAFPAAEQSAAPIPSLRRVPQAVPRVLFDPRAETARLRQQP